MLDPTRCKITIAKLNLNLANKLNLNLANKWQYSVLDIKVFIIVWLRHYMIVVSQPLLGLAYYCSVGIVGVFTQYRCLSFGRFGMITSS